MDRITDKHLQALVDRINRELGMPTEAYTKDASGKYRANVGNFHLDHAYSGVNLARMYNEGGGISQPLGGAYGTKRELYDKLAAMLVGIDFGRRPIVESEAA